MHIITPTASDEGGVVDLDLPPLPLVPYAVSMATTVVYRAWRDKVRDLHSTYANLCLCCEGLEALSLSWTGARGFARLAMGLRGAIMDVVEGRGRRGSPGINIGNVVDSPRQLGSGITMNTNDTREQAMRAPAPSSSDRDGDGDGEPVQVEGGYEQGEDFWAGLERACLHFDTSFDDFLEYRGFGDFGEFVPGEYGIQQGDRG